ncbi:hypothetical protein B0T21DRAFT_377953 [Apiosordaria backusii]|uniref:Uncharacterized protein n=1 Tax=Apiosordaria backusii TaxID=314023 RepID=A0AA39ZV58_9PEZI|nr:hypothetical protein B0T21DRAFT_377953 [Apiosordaria backusii]
MEDPRIRDEQLKLQALHRQYLEQRTSHVVNTESKKAAIFITDYLRETIVRCSEQTSIITKAVVATTGNEYLHKIAPGPNQIRLKLVRHVVSHLLAQFNIRPRPPAVPKGTHIIDITGDDEDNIEPAASAIASRFAVTIDDHLLAVKREKNADDSLPQQSQPGDEVGPEGLSSPGDPARRDGPGRSDGTVEERQDRTGDLEQQHSPITEPAPEAEERPLMRTIPCAEVVGQDWIFEFPTIGPGWFILRCDKEIPVDGYCHHFRTNPIVGNRALKHFTNRATATKCHSTPVPGDWTLEMIVREYGYKGKSPTVSFHFMHCLLSGVQYIR